MGSSQIIIDGISAELLSALERFLNRSRASWTGSELLPFIGLVRSSTLWVDGEEIIERGEHFVMGAIERRLIDSEILFKTDGLDVAIRIPEISRFYGRYFFDFCDGEIVNIHDKIIL